MPAPPAPLLVLALLCGPKLKASAHPEGQRGSGRHGGAGGAVGRAGLLGGMGWGWAVWGGGEAARGAHRAYRDMVRTGAPSSLASSNSCPPPPVRGRLRCQRRLLTAINANGRTQTPSHCPLRRARVPASAAAVRLCSPDIQPSALIGLDFSACGTGMQQMLPCIQRQRRGWEKWSPTTMRTDCAKPAVSWLEGRPAMVWL